MQTLHFHHVGIPVKEKIAGMIYNESLKLYTTDYFDNPYGIEWMYFDHDNPLPDVIKTVPHVAYRVDNLLKIKILFSLQSALPKVLPLLL